MTDPIPANPELPAPAATPSAAPAATSTPATAIKAPDPVTPSPAPSDVDWRKEFAGGDEKLLKQLGRFASKDALAKSYKELSDKVSSGELKAPLREGATEAEIANWRKANNIPETPDKYDLTMSDGLVIGEDDKPMINDFLTEAHKINAPTEFVKTAVSHFLKMRETTLAKVAEQDETQQHQTIDEMKQEWGGDYKINMSLISTMLGAAPDGLGDLILKARMPNGQLIGNNPNAARFLAGLARELNPAATIVPAGAEASMASVESEMRALEAKQGTKAYTKADSDRYVKLTEIKLRAESRKAA